MLPQQHKTRLFAELRRYPSPDALSRRLVRRVVQLKCSDVQ